MQNDLIQSGASLGQKKSIEKLIHRKIHFSVKHYTRKSETRLLKNVCHGNTSRSDAREFSNKICTEEYRNKIFLQVIH